MFCQRPSSWENEGRAGGTRPGRWRNCVIRLLTLAIILSCQPWWSAATPAGPAEPAAEAKPEGKEVTGFRIKIRSLQQNISKQELQMAEYQAKERNILGEMEAVEEKLAKQQEKLRVLEEKMANQQRLIDDEEGTLARTLEEKAKVEEHLKKRITAYYTMGDIGLLNVTFSTRTLPELLTFHDAFDTLVAYDQKVFQKYLATVKELERSKRALDLQKAVLEEFIAELVEENKVLEQNKNEKQLLLSQVQNKVRLNRQAIEEMQRAAEELSRAIVTIKDLKDRKFKDSKGNLPPPVEGIVATLFNQEKVNKLGIARKSQGIELKAADGTEIMAIADGEIIFAGYLRGYGNTVIIHHGLQYYTVTSRIEKLLVAKGQEVKAETPIGVMGDTAVLFDEGLYFEVRHGRDSLDPLLWLDPKRLTVQQDHPAGPADIAGSAQ